MTTIHVHLFTGFIGWALPVLVLCGAAYIFEGIFGALEKLADRVADRLFPPPKRPARLQDGENTLRAFVFAADIPALKAAALAKARELYGPDAVLEVHAMDGIGTSATSGRPPFNCTVTIRRTDDGEAWSRPAEPAEVAAS